MEAKRMKDKKEAKRSVETLGTGIENKKEKRKYSANSFSLSLF